MRVLHAGDGDGRGVPRGERHRQAVGHEHEQSHVRLVREVPVHHYHRAYGESQFLNFRRVARTLWELSGLWLRLKVVRHRPNSSGSATPPRDLSRTAS